MNSQRQSKRRHTVVAVAIACVLVAGIALMLTNSPLGAYILLDYLADDDSGLVADPAAGPIELSEFVTGVAAAHAMPPQIDQPSGMTYLEADRAFAVVTDQAELFVVSDDFTTVRSNTAVLGGLLVTRQGRMEAVANIDGQRVAVTGEIGGRIDVWRKGAEPGFSLEASIDLSSFAGGGNVEIEGFAHNPQTGEFYLSSDETLAIAVVDANGRLLRELTFEDDLLGRLKSGRALSEYRLSGLDYADGLLYTVSEPYNTLFVIDRAWSGARGGHRERRTDLGHRRAGRRGLPAAGSQLGRSASAVAGGDAGLIGCREGDSPIRRGGSRVRDV